MTDDGQPFEIFDKLEGSNAMTHLLRCNRCKGTLYRDEDAALRCTMCTRVIVSARPAPALALVDPRLLPRERPGRKQATEPKPKENRSSRQYARKLAQRYETPATPHAAAGG